MSNAETIKDFLISLGFDIDSAGERKFSAVVAGVTANVLKLGAVVEGAALAVVGFTTQIASGLDKVYWASQRTGATVEGIRGLGYAASQMGSDAAAAQNSLESLARFMRSSPGAEGFINRLGVQTRGANGQMRDTSAIFTALGDKLSKMPTYRANQYAQILGIDENTLLAMRRGFGQFGSEYAMTAKKIGFNADIAAKQSNRFMTSMSALTMTLGQARDKIGSNLASGLAGSLDALRKQLLDNWPKIEAVVMKVIKGILWMAEVFGRMAWRASQAVSQVIDWWKKLDLESRKLLGVFGAMLVGWRMLNSAFLMSPIGLITAAILTLALLYDDYMTWKENGKSLIDWSKWEPGIKKAKEAIIWIRDKLLALKDAAGGWQNTLEILATFMAVTWAAKMVKAITSVTSSVGGLANSLKGLGTAGTIGALLAIEKYVAKPLEDKYTWLKDNPITNFLNNLPGLDTVDEWGKKVLPWRQDEPEPEQHAQSGKRPKATKNGEALLGWLQPKLTQLEALYNLPAGLLRSVALTESSGNQFAVGPMTKYGQAKGLFQFMEKTAAGLGLHGNDVFDPEKSAAAAAKYLAQLMRINGGDLEKTLASYNWGIGNVQKFGMALMPQETRNYIPKVKSNMPGNGLNQQTVININGVSDPVRAGEEVANRQYTVNTRLTQQINKEAY
ncbi:transglycosylase SLT domain-containing protein [Serratia fonticola]|uniref:lytic transglycosylase domain-containing protein n=1 Tax=Serratia fonticola TaxID=47917 RepID=UPI001378F480|nr:lytic transglycosylase domain-containing protein [Serratia fonticola]NBJ34418.1 transglycosylase SLT domain-containing protein [Serratia fonticola]